MIELAIDHELKTATDSLGYQGTREESVRVACAEQLIRLQWRALSDWGLPRAPDFELFDDAVRRQQEIGSEIGAVECEVDAEERGVTTRKCLERERARRADRETAEKQVQSLASRVMLSVIAGRVDAMDVDSLKRQVEAAEVTSANAFNSHIRAEQELRNVELKSRERVSVLRVRLRGLDADLARAQADEARARSWPRHAVRDPLAESYAAAPAPDWDVRESNLYGTATHSAVYAPVRGFLTIIELSTYLGKDPDTLIRWAGIAAEGRAKGPFPAAFRVLDATLGKKNRRIWLSDLDSKWVTDHEQWTALTTSRWPSTWPRKYSTEKFATRHND